METKHYVLLIGIVISISLSYIAVLIRFDYSPKPGETALWLLTFSFIFPWILGGIIFWVIKKLFLDDN